MSLQERIRNAVRDVPDFPKPGILFKDITPLLLDPDLATAINEEIVRQLSDVQVNAVCAIESRGFLFGFLIAHAMRVPFIPVRKEGKLPGETVAYSYDLEYGSATMEVHAKDIVPGWKVLIHDDLLATGGTAVAAAELMQRQGAEVSAFAFIIGLSFLHGSERLRPYSRKIVTLVSY